MDTQYKKIYAKSKGNVERGKTKFPKQKIKDDTIIEDYWHDSFDRLLNDKE